jgi:hypothetical protein
VLAVSLSWKYPEDFMQFCLANYKDDPGMKLQLVQIMSQLVCFKCSPFKVA